MNFLLLLRGISRWLSPADFGDVTASPVRAAGAVPVSVSARPVHGRKARRPNLASPFLARRTSLEPLEDRRLLAAILYVNDDASGSNTGASWANAYTDLQSALAAATAGDEIWVAAGTYKPTSTISRETSFNLKTRVSVYGGFVSTETSRDQRDWTTNVTTLSGDIAYADNQGDNSLHVVYASGVTDVTLDGFTITSGRADNGPYHGDFIDPSFLQGGGVRCIDSSLTLSHLLITANQAYSNDATHQMPSVYGGGMYISGGAATLSDVTFSDNSADSEYGIASGGGLSIVGGATTLSGIAFVGNSTNSCGAGMYCSGEGSVTLTNVTFTGNDAKGAGGGMYALLSSPTLTDVTFMGNRADRGAGIFNMQSSPILNNVIFSANTAYFSSGGAISNYSSSSPTLVNVKFLNNTSVDTGGGVFDCQSSSTLINATFEGNSATNGGGAVSKLSGDEYIGSTTLTNCVLFDNGSTPITGGSITIAHSIVEGGWTGDGNVDADPMFVDAANGDLHLMAGSPAIDSGSGTGAPSTDLDGNQRPLDGNGDGTAGFDMGAYEFKASNQPPTAEAGGPYTVVVGHSVPLSGAASSDTDGTLTLYEWDFNYDGSTFDVDATGASTSFSAVALQPGGTQTVALRVTDNNGTQSTIDTATVTAMAPQFTPGLYDPAASTFYLRTANTTGNADHTFAYGEANGGWTTLVGDWNGDDTTGVGLYDPDTSTFYLTNVFESGFAEYTFGYGEAGGGWIPLVGDWDGDGRAGVGLYDPHTSTFYLTNSLASGFAEHTFGYGEPDAGWTPQVGDWNGDGQTGVGLFNPHASTFYLTNSFQTGFAEHTFGYGEPNASWQPMVGDWNGDRSDGVGLFASQSSTFYLTNAFTSGYAQYTFGYGEPDADWKPLVGDWNGSGSSGVGLYAPSSSTFYLTSTLTSGYAEYTVGFGQPGANWQPLVGCWTSAGPVARAVDRLDLAGLAAKELSPEAALTGLDTGVA